jgi:hypothetical protein
MSQPSFMTFFTLHVWCRQPDLGQGLSVLVEDRKLQYPGRLLNHQCLVSPEMLNQFMWRETGILYYYFMIQY